MELRGFKCSYKKALFGHSFPQSFPQLRLEQLGPFAGIGAYSYESESFRVGRGDAPMEIKLSFGRVEPES